MPGRSCSCVLVILSLLLPTAGWSGQSARLESHSAEASKPFSRAPDAKPEFAPPRLGSPPISEPVSPPPILPRQPVALPAPVGLAQISRAAGIIFSGKVTAVARGATARDSAVETVAITFWVESAIRGATPGQELTILQWMGLWSGGQRYRVGEHVLLFLYPPSKLGLTSSVSGPMGRFVVDPLGRVLFTARHLSAFRADPVLGGKSRIRLADFGLAVQRSEEEAGSR
jgi:hypothetical protein